MIHVVAGAVTDAAGRVLIAQRPPGKHLAGGWEFPGGKLEPGETRVAGLARELREELGITIAAPRPLLRLHHTYDFGEILIDMWVVTRFEGEPRGLDGQALRWCTLDELPAVDLLPADAPIVRALRLPERLTVTESPYFSVANATFDNGARLAGRQRLHGVRVDGLNEARHADRHGTADFLVLRCKATAAEVRGLCESVSIPVFVQGWELEAAWMLGASGLSLLPD